jgi:hypothetical protein
MSCRRFSARASAERTTDLPVVSLIDFRMVLNRVRGHWLLERQNYALRVVGGCATVDKYISMVSRPI